MNPRLSCLQPYPFERLRALLSGVVLPPLSPVRLSIGEPQHTTPDLVRSALVDSLAGLSTYPATAGLDALREAGIAKQKAVKAERDDLVLALQFAIAYHRAALAWVRKWR